MKFLEWANNNGEIFLGILVVLFLFVIFFAIRVVIKRENDLRKITIRRSGESRKITSYKYSITLPSGLKTEVWYPPICTNDETRDVLLNIARDFYDMAKNNKTAVKKVTP